MRGRYASVVTVEEKVYVTEEEVCVMFEIQKYSEMHEVTNNKDGMETRMIRRGKKGLYL